MDLYSGDPYWLTKNGFLYTYPGLNKNISCDIAIIGGGITGAIIAFHLNRVGVNVVVVDERHIGFGSTCSSTALLQYEIDTSLTELKKYVGEKNAEDCYRLCEKSINGLKNIADSISLDSYFRFKKSIYLASNSKDARSFSKEFEARKKIDIDIDLLSESDIMKMIHIRSDAALLSQTAAQLDPFLFTHGIFQHVKTGAANIFDRCKITEVKESPDNVKLQTENGYTITSQKVVFATGYESQKYLNKKVSEFNSTYAIISKPLDENSIKHIKPYIIWESARPYLYIRTTEDNRIIIGGKDEKFYNPDKRDFLISKKTKDLETEFLKKFPEIEFETDFSWAGTFAETKDGLPYIGQHKKYKHAYFALGFGGNGIVFSEIAGQVITEMYTKGKSPHEHLFSFTR
jgi:glycine/D-amino acid oxidase-like deaminating enzyme